MISASANAETSVGQRRIVNGLLRTGLVGAMALMGAGLVVALATGARDDIPVKLFALGEASGLGDRLMALGIVVLGLTPALRVLVLASIWARQRDWRFVGVATAVVVTLVIATLLGGA